MSNDAKFKETLRQCRICDDNLVSAIDERVEQGESVRSICQDYEDFQRQLHGEVFLPRETIRRRYQRVKGVAGQAVTNVTTPAQQVIRLIYKAFKASDAGSREVYFNQAKAITVPRGDLQVEIEEEARKLAPAYRMVAACIDFLGVGDYDILIREMEETLEKIKELQSGKSPKR